MIETLARIAGYAAKGLYAVMVARGGMMSVAEMEQAGYKRAQRFSALAELTESGVILKVGYGVYRVKESGGADSESGGADFLENRRKSGGADSESGIADSIEVLLESASPKKYRKSPAGRTLKGRKSGGADSESGIADSSLHSVNVVNVVNLTNQPYPRFSILINFAFIEFKNIISAKII